MLNQEKTDQQGTKRLLKLVRICRTAEEFVKDITERPHWYLCNEFLKKQTKPYFIQFFTYYKGGN